MQTQVCEVIRDVDGWLAESRGLFVSVEHERSSLEEGLLSLQGLGDRLEAPLFILLCGGTGVGKSTLLNAMAGAEIAESSPIRPTTDRFTIYHHVANELCIPEELAALGQRVRHERSLLRDKVLIDAPDFDSTTLEHKSVLRKALELSDLVVVLATPEKYANAELHRILRAYRAGREYVFLLNRLDHGIEPEVVDDFRGELSKAGFAEVTVLKLSARDALAHKLGQQSSADLALGDFERLERIIERELSRVRIREIKRKNLDTLTRRLVSRLNAAVPQDLEGRLARWLAAARRLAEELGGALGARFARGVTRSERLRSELEARLATSYEGLMGVYQALVWAIRGLAGRGMAGGPAALALEVVGATGVSIGAGARESGGLKGSLRSVAAPPEPPPGQDEETLAEEIELAAQRMDDLGDEEGISPPAEPLCGNRALAMAGSARSAASREIEHAVLGLWHPRDRSARARALSVLLNLAPVAVIVYTLVRWLHGFAVGTPMPPGWFTAGLLITLFVLVALGRLIDVVARRRAPRLVERIAQSAASAASERVEAPLLGRVSAHQQLVSSAGARLAALSRRVGGRCE
ncbi:GTPase [Planctomycetota bacterium]